MSETSSQPVQSNRRTLDKTGMIEAALYVTGRPVDIKTIGTIVSIRSDDKIKELARQLKDKYMKENGALEILELSDGRFVMQLKPKFAPHVKRLATRQLLTLGPMKTLSFIAYRQPVTQSYLARVRGNLAYSHVRQLQEVGLIAEEKLGRTKILRTTPNFADYFNLSQDMQTMKRQLERIFETIKAEKVKEPSSETAQKVLSEGTL